MPVRCEKCGKMVELTEYDEFTPPDQAQGIEITPEILDGDKAHIWKRTNGNLYIHYPEADNQ